MLQANKVGITGTRKGLTKEQRETLQKFLVQLGAKELHEGDCIGVDAEAAYMAKNLGMHVVSHPPYNPKYRAYAVFDEERPLADYLIRNERIVNESELLIGVPKGIYEELRSGTWACIRYAQRVKKQVFVIYPDGMLVSR